MTSAGNNCGRRAPGLKTSKKALKAKSQKLPESTLSIQVGKTEEDTAGITCSDGTPTGKASSEEQQDVAIA